MKFLTCLLVLCPTLFFGNPIQDIYAKATEIAKDFDIDDTEKALFEHYSREVPQLDLATLKENPEVIFRKALSGIDHLGDSIEEIKDRLLTLSSDFAFVMQNSTNDSRLFQAAQAEKEDIDYLIASSFQTSEQLSAAFTALTEISLRKWATDPHATGNALREDVYHNINSHPDLFQSLVNYLTLIDTNPDIALGRIKFSKTKIELTVDEGAKYLLFTLEWITDGSSHSFSTEI